MTHCRKCGSTITTATLASGHSIQLSAEPDLVGGQVLVLDGQAMFLSGRALGDARRAGLGVYARHGITCPRWWSRVDIDGKPI